MNTQICTKNEINYELIAISTFLFDDCEFTVANGRAAVDSLLISKI